jgi:D-sedoheptulose 7-phosphate isomerase
MSATNRIAAHFEDHIEVARRTHHVLASEIERAIETCVNTFNHHGKILACGNGGSAADAQHLVAELVGRFERDRTPLAGVALTTDTSILTAVGNDYGFDHIFSRQVTALGQPGDTLFAISTSGHSPNVRLAIEAAHAKGMLVIALTGKGGGAITGMLKTNDVNLCIPHDRTMRIQEMHLMMLHLICDGIDAHILGD